jgi:hypothetical protein
MPFREGVAEQAQQDFSVGHVLVRCLHPADERDLRGNPHLTLGDSAVRLFEMLELQLAVYYESSERLTLPQYGIGVALRNDPHGTGFTAYG